MEQIGTGALTPAYVWKTGTTFFLSKKEKIVADTFLATRNYAECAKALKAEGFNRNWITCKRWLEKGHVKQYIEEQLEERGLLAGWSEGRWLKVMSDHMTGKQRMKMGDAYVMKLIGDNRGFFQQDKGLNVINQINFTER